jgi:chromatin remodeling complex protein RSC6
MAKSTATKTKSASAQPAKESENVVVSESTEKKVKKVKSTASKETVAPVSDVAPVPTPVESDASVVVPVEAAVVDAENSIVEKSMEFTAKLHQMNIMMTTLKSDFKVIEKAWARELKASQKLNTKRKRKSGNRPPSGFVKPALISDELAKFLDKQIGSEMARTDVTKDINNYIRANKLQDSANGRKIIPDKKLATLLKIKPNEELTYFNLQKFLSIHFPKSVKAEAVAGGVTASA